MTSQSEEKRIADEMWRWYLTGDLNEGARRAQSRIKWLRRIFRLLPGEDRCLNCNAPLSGSGASLVRLTGVRASSFNPHLCNQCEDFVRKYEGGTEVELTMLFADVRGSTSLSMSTTPMQYSQLINRFYKIVSSVLIKRNAMVNRLVGDQVIGLFVPRLAGPWHARDAIQAGREILLAIAQEPSTGSEIPFGVGIHQGKAYVGSVGSSKAVNEIAVLGDSANIAARLSSAAEAGEIVVSEAAAKDANLGKAGWELRRLDLRGIRDPITVRVARVTPH